MSRLRFTGDVILSTPLLDALAHRFPGAAIDYLCEQPHDQVLWKHPRIRRIRTLSPGSGIRETLAMARSLRGQYDWVLDLFGNPRSALLTALSGAKLRVGLARMPRGLAYNHRPEIPDGLAATAHHLAILESLTGVQELSAPKVHLSGNERETGARLLADRGVGPASIAILLGASQTTKEWPLEFYARL
nr:glycosyltransferase family 9 protein [bacterium]